MQKPTVITRQPGYGADLLVSAEATHELEHAGPPPEVPGLTTKKPRSTGTALAGTTTAAVACWQRPRLACGAAL
jgi:hypothetical protein